MKVTFDDKTQQVMAGRKGVCVGGCCSISAAAGLWFCAARCAFAAPPKGVQVVADAANRRVDITIDGQPFTSYIWPTTLKKPVLYPIIDADGVTLTRGWPLEPRPGERTDHPHHDGLWFNYSNVNGFRFLEQLRCHPAAARAQDGHDCASTESFPPRAAHRAASWLRSRPGSTGRIIPSCRKPRRYVFAHSGRTRTIDLIVTLKALDHVVFNDDKDGLLGLRVARWLESPEEKGGTFHRCERHGDEGCGGGGSAWRCAATGEYLTSEGVKGEAAWSTRGRWCSLTGHDDAGHTVTIAIFDHPGNVGYPTYWHARGYGLFAANPLGRHMFDPTQPPLDYTLEKGQTTTFRYRLVFYTHAATLDELNREADAFAAEKK